MVIKADLKLYLTGLEGASLSRSVLLGESSSGRQLGHSTAGKSLLLLYA